MNPPAFNVPLTEVDSIVSLSPRLPYFYEMVQRVTHYQQLITPMWLVVSRMDHVVGRGRESIRHTLPLGKMTYVMHLLRKWSCYCSEWMFSALNFNCSCAPRSFRINFYVTNMVQTKKPSFLASKHLDLMLHSPSNVRTFSSTATLKLLCWIHQLVRSCMTWMRDWNRVACGDREQMSLVYRYFNIGHQCKGHILAGYLEVFLNQLSESSQDSGTCKSTNRQ